MYTLQPTASRCSRRGAAWLVCIGLLATQASTPDVALGQGVSGKSGSASPAGGGGMDGQGALGFSIESEMLTYRALESNSEAIACDIAAYLGGASVDFTNPPAGAICALKGSGNNDAGIVIAPFDRNAFDDFQLWRANMEIMRELRSRAAVYCPESTVLAVESRGATAATTAAATAAGAALGLTPVGPALAIAQTALGLFASEAANAPVVGTIQDQAFMNGVARQLRTLNVAVLMPSTYAPYSLAATDSVKSPFLSSLDRLFEARRCILEQSAAPGTKATDKARIDQLVTEIDSYESVLRGVTVVQSTPNSSSDSKSTKRPDTSAAPPSTPTTVPAPATSPFATILSGDGFARKLGVDPATGLLPEKPKWRHLLLIKALESGGTLAKSSNIFGTKIRYSGGSVGTYALFTLDGELECSGNVYDYGGSIPAEKFQPELRRFNPDPASQFVFQRGNCRVTAGH
jgi:hypothetical protein